MKGTPLNASFRTAVRHRSGLSACLLCILVTVAPISTALAAQRVLFPPELTGFHPYEANPVFVASPGSWDDELVERGWIMRDASGWRMWFTGSARNQRRMGYATSSDGIRWERHPDNPLLPDVWVEDMTVVAHDGTLHMFAEGRGDRAHRMTSSDGITWTEQGTLDVRQTNGQPIVEGPFGTPTVWLEGGVWWLFYERADLGIWLARSIDLKTWTNVSDEPVIKLGTNVYDQDLIAMNQVFRYNGLYYAVLHGAGPGKPRKWSVWLAVSDDLIHWYKYWNNPITYPGANRSSAMLIHDGERFRLYTTNREVTLSLGMKLP